MAHKTKAAMPGRQCINHNDNRGECHITRLLAGGQSLSVAGIPVSVQTAPLPQFPNSAIGGVNRNTGEVTKIALVAAHEITGAHYETSVVQRAFLHCAQMVGTSKASGKYCKIFVVQCLTYFAPIQGYQPMAYTPWIMGMLQCCTPGISRDIGQCRISPLHHHHGDFDHESRHPGNGYRCNENCTGHRCEDDRISQRKIASANPKALFSAQLLGSMPWRRNFSRQASSTHAEKFALGVCDFSCSTLLSIFSISSCGKRIFFCADFALIALVAIFPPVCGEGTPYQKKRLTCTPTENIVGPHLESLSIQETAKPGSAATLTGPLTNNVRGTYIMADQQHTQTRPKFTWLFLGTPKGQTCTPTVIRTTADTEEEARAWYPRWDLVFAAKIRSECQLYQYTNGAFELTVTGLEVRHD